MPHDPPAGLLSDPIYARLSPGARSLILAIADACPRRLPAGGVGGASSLDVIARASACGLRPLAAWCGVVLLVADGFAQAIELADDGGSSPELQLGLPPRRRPPISPISLLERRAPWPAGVTACLKHAAIAVDLDGGDRQVREALLFGLLGPLNRI